jgi:hypothetical protein
VFLIGLERAGVVLIHVHALALALAFSVTRKVGARFIGEEGGGWEESVAR